LGIPLIKISREEMIRALHDGQSRQDKADGLGRFLESKADEAHAQMRMNGATASIIFIDEMESLFLKRDPSTSSREELDETNQMLRILEEVMQKHVDIFFMAATNNIQFVDDAAIRVGRFGIRLQLKPVRQEDAKALVRGVCEMLNLSFEELSACPSFKDLCEVCCGMVPLPIQNAMVNRYVACAAPPSDPAQLIEMFVESVRVMKELTTNC
jgi:AAA+ superfamily predicted ATPase